jgi:hypothetical protein
METIRQSVSVDPRRTTADSMVVRVVASHLVVPLTRAIGSVLVVLPRGSQLLAPSRRLGQGDGSSAVEGTPAERTR